MEQKTKFIIIGLIGLSLVFLIFAMTTFSSKQLIQRKAEELQRSLDEKVETVNSLESKIRSLEGEKTAISARLDSLKQERDQLEAKYNDANRKMKELTDKLKSQPSQQQQTVQQVQPSIQSQDAYWGSILKAKTDLELQLANLRNESKTLQITNEQLQREKSDSELELNNLKREKDDLKRMLDYNQKLMDSISQELVREKNDKIQIQDGFKSLKSENTILLRQLKSLNNRKITLEKKLQELQEQNSALERRFTEMETMLTDKITQVGDLKDNLEGIQRGSAKIEEAIAPKRESVDLPPIIVRPTPEQEISQEASEAFPGSILAVDRDNNFVIIDLGEGEGARLGDTFRVYRDGKAIATLEVIQTRKDISACDIKKEYTPIKIGDKIR